MTQAEWMASRIDRWLIDHLDEFDPFAWHDSGSAVARRKSFSELALYADTALAAGKPADQRIMDHLERRAGDERMMQLLRRDPRDLTLFGPFLQLMERRGKLDGSFRRHLSALISSDALFAVERPPFRMLEVAQLAHVFGVECHRELARSAVRSGCLRYPPNLFASVEMDAYAVTHAVFYLTDFGRGPIVDEPVDWEGVRTVLRSALLLWAGRGNLDVALECAVALRLARDPPSGLEQWVLDKAAAQIAEEGVITSPHGEPGRWAAPLSQKTRHWLAHYHPTMIAGYLARVAPPEGALSEEQGLRIAALSAAFAELSRYHLGKSASMLTRIAGRMGNGPFDEEIALARAFIERQRRDDGGFGYFVDEQVLMENCGEGGSPAWDAYKRTASEACSALLDG